MPGQMPQYDPAGTTGKKQKRPKLTPYQKEMQKEVKAADTRKQKERQAGVMSFDSFFGEAG